MNELEKSRAYRRVYQQCQNGGMNETQSHEMALDHASRQAKRNEANRARNEALRSVGLVRVRGNMGGTYWE